MQSARVLGRVGRGITLMELLVGFGLVSFILLTAMPNMGRSRSSTKAAAQVMASALQEARLRAINRGVPVAIVVPSGNGSYGHSSAYYVLEGEHPKVTRVVELGREQPGVGLFVGHWAVDSAALGDPTALPTVELPTIHKFEEDFDPHEWTMPEPKDYAFIFAPSGRFYSNGLPHFDGATHMVVTHGLEASAGSLPPGTSPVTPAPNTYQPIRLGSPYTISVNPMGQVSVHSGLAGTDGSVSIGSEAPQSIGAIPPSVDGPPTSPTITSVNVDTKPSEYVPDNDGRITDEVPSTLSVVARGDGPLFAQWTADVGRFSHQGFQPMEYDPETDSWVSLWSYNLPSGMDEDELTTLELTVRNNSGTTATPVSGSELKLYAPTDFPKVVYVDLPTHHIIYMANSDGTEEHPVYRSSRLLEYPTFAPDGSMFACVENRTEIPIFFADGSLYKRLSMRIHQAISLAWSPTGTRLAVGGIVMLPPMFPGPPRPSRPNMWILDVRSGRSIQVASETSSGSPSWSPDGIRLAVSKAGGRFDIVDARDGTVLQTFVGRDPVFSPDGLQVAYADSAGDIFYRNADGSGSERALPLGPPRTRWSREVVAWHKSSGQLLVTESSGPGVWYELDGTPRATISDEVSLMRSIASDRGYVVYQRNSGAQRVVSSDGAREFELPDYARYPSIP